MPNKDQMATYSVSGSGILYEGNIKIGQEGILYIRDGFSRVWSTNRNEMGNRTKSAGSQSNHHPKVPVPVPGRTPFALSFVPWPFALRSTLFSLYCGCFLQLGIFLHCPDIDRLCWCESTFFFFVVFFLFTAFIVKVQFNSFFFFPRTPRTLKITVSKFNLSLFFFWIVIFVHLCEQTFVFVFLATSSTTTFSFLFFLPLLFFFLPPLWILIFTALFISFSSFPTCILYFLSSYPPHSFCLSPLPLAFFVFFCSLHRCVFLLHSHYTLPLLFVPPFPYLFIKKIDAQQKKLLAFTLFFWTFLISH